MKKQAKVVSYRRRCRQMGMGTGLSHYILLAPKVSKDKPNADSI